MVYREREFSWLTAGGWEQPSWRVMTRRGHRTVRQRECQLGSVLLIKPLVEDAGRPFTKRDGLDVGVGTVIVGNVLLLSEPKLPYPAGAPPPQESWWDGSRGQDEPHDLQNKFYGWQM